MTQTNEIPSFTEYMDASLKKRKSGVKKTPDVDEILQVTSHQVTWLPGQSSRCAVKYIYKE